MKIVAAKKILAANDQLAAANRAQFTSEGLYAVNLLGSPGCGKTTLLEGLIGRLRGRLVSAVIEGDIAERIDALRMEQLGVPVVQIHTDGMCHLDANMIAEAAGDLDRRDVQLLFVENLGNLVCTAGFDLGEHLRMVVLSVPEGDDKIVKYPAIFQRSHALAITKVDLLPHCSFDVARVRGDMQRLAPAADVFEVSARSATGLAALADWLAAKREAALAAARPPSRS
jgi:hydrogenase nickel incorporation protein HypB